jgi:hypothetical protein
MPSKSEGERRKLLRREIEQRSRAAEEARMPISKSQLKELFDYLDSALAEGCDHTLRHSQVFLRTHGYSEAIVVPWLGKYGGYCDCEVLANVEDRWGAEG